MANARLVELGHDMRIDHRSNAARGLELEAQNKIGPAAARRARQGEDGERTAEHRAIARRNGERLLADPALALEALTQQQSTFTRVDLARLVHRQSDGAEQFAAVMAKVGAAPELVRVGEDGRGRMRFSTRELVQVERQMIGGAVALTRRTTHRVDEQRRTAALAGTQLSEEQHLAYLHVTRSRDLAVVVGIAGGGKSTMLGMARAAWAGQGYRVRGAALAGIAAESLEGSAGIESRTIASWEYAWDQGRELLTAADVLVVDEGGMIGSHQLGRLVARVQQAGAKLVLVGDAEQLQAIEAGAAFRAIADQVGVVAITEPRRQLQEWQRQATKELATARSADALRRYEAAGMVHGHATREAARDGVIAGWDAARRQSPSHSRIILAHERADVQALNEAARAVRRAAGELGPDHALQAEIGVRAFATGDRLYFLRNERGLGVKNGTLGTVERIEFGPNGARLTVRLDRAEGAGTGREVSFDLAEYADIDHGYAATIHKNQGVTVDHAHVLATAAMDRHLIYVAMSRHRHAAQLHWGEDEFGGRLHAILGRERAKDTTLDYAQPEENPVAAYAERRSLAPVMPPSEIVLRPTDRPASEERPERGVRVPQQQAEPEAPAPITTPRRSKFAGLKLAAKRGGAPGGQWPQEQGEPVAPQPSPRRVSEAIEREERLQRALATYAEAWADAGRMTRAGLPVLAHQAQALERSGQALEAIAPDLTRETRALLERSPELAGGIAGPGGAAALSAAIGAEQGARQALDERGRAAVRTWNVLEREYDAATKAYEWDAQREVGTRMEAFAEALKRDPQLDRVLRERGGALGVAEGSRLDQVLHAREIDSRLLWKLGIEHGPRPGRGMSLGM